MSVTNYSVGNGPYAALSTGDGHVWVLNNTDNSITILNASDGSFVATYTGDLSGPQYACFDGTNVWVSNYTYPGSVTKINATTFVEVGKYRVGLWTPGGICYDAGSNTIWVSDTNNSYAT